MELHISVLKPAVPSTEKYVAIWHKTAWHGLRAVDPTLGIEAHLYRFFDFCANYIFMANVIWRPFNQGWLGTKITKAMICGGIV